MSGDQIYSDDEIHQTMADSRHRRNVYVQYALEDYGPDSDEYRRAVGIAEREERFLNLMSECMVLRDRRREA